MDERCERDAATTPSPRIGRDSIQKCCSDAASVARREHVKLEDKEHAIQFNGSNEPNDVGI